jgi:hypothetical protein
VSGPKNISTGHWERSIRSGRTGELVVGARLVELGFDLFWPVNEQPPIDLISVWKDTVVNRVQIKTKSIPRESQLSQEVRVGGTDAKKYDYLIAYLVTQTAFYVVPAKRVCTGSRKNLIFYPNGKTSCVEQDLEEYRDAWHLLR